MGTGEERGPTLVTGATGFVGGHAAEALREAGHRLRFTVRPRSDTRWLRGLGGETVTADLGDREALERAVAGASTVVHAAGLTSAPRPALFRAVNVEGTVRLARAARRAGVARFVFVSSLSAAGPEGRDGPVSAYAASKREAERALRRLEGEMEVVALRPGGVYGPRDTDLLPLFRAAARGWLPVPAGGASLQPIYASDVASAVVRAAGPSAAGFGPHALAQQERHGWEDVRRALEEELGRRVRRLPIPPALFVAAGAVAELVGRLVGRRPVLDRRRARDVARHRWTCDPGPAMEALGWRPEVSLPEGVRRTARWYAGAGWL